MKGWGRNTGKPSVLSWQMTSNSADLFNLSELVELSDAVVEDDVVVVVEVVGSSHSTYSGQLQESILESK